MPDRFFADCDFDTPIVQLNQSESHHLAHVLRSSAGERVTLFNGRGRIAEAEIEQISRRAVSLRVLEVSTALPNRPEIVLATAVPKGDRFRWMVEKLAELGVSRLIPLVTARSVVKPGDGKLGKMRQTAIAAAKQSAAPYLLSLEKQRNWSEFLETLDSSARCFVAHPGCKPIPGFSLETHLDQPVILAIGPEGGFTDEEVEDAAERGAQCVSLGSNLLRVETAAIAFAACWRLCGGRAAWSADRPS